MFKPRFTITPKITSNLVKIEALKERIKGLPITPLVIKTLSETAKLQSIHYSTQIEGNRLSQKEVSEVILGKKIARRKRDEGEIKGYYAALEWLEKNVSSPITEDGIKTIHALVCSGGRTRVRPSAYRDGQNVIRESGNNNIVYMPPEAKDVPLLMRELVQWLETNSDLPCPIAAAAAHCQFAAIHPYYDGNGRTARLLTTWVLHRGGYDLKGLYSLEEYYARDLKAYYKAISIGSHYNYYFGREKADITPWIKYFSGGMLDSFESVARRAGEAAELGEKDKSALLRRLSPRERKVLTLFEAQAVITANDVASLFEFSARSARLLCAKFAENEFLVVDNPAPKIRSYRLADELEAMIAGNMKIL